MSTLTYTHVTTVKTPLKRTYIMNLIEIIRTALYYILYAGIALTIIVILLSQLIRDTKELREWAKGRDEEGHSPDAEK